MKREPSDYIYRNVTIIDWVYTPDEIRDYLADIYDGDERFRQNSFMILFDEDLYHEEFDVESKYMTLKRIEGKKMFTKWLEENDLDVLNQTVFVHVWW